MEYRPLGRTGVQVSKLCLGTMMFGAWGSRDHDDVVPATKFFMPMGHDPNRRGGSRRRIVRAVEDSLRRLGTDWIDLC